MRETNTEVREKAEAVHSNPPLVASLELANAISWLTVIEVMDIVGETFVTLGSQLFLVVAEIPERVSNVRGPCMKKNATRQ